MATDSFHSVIIDSKLEPIELDSSVHKFISVAQETIERFWLTKVDENQDRVNTSNYKAIFLSTNGPCTQTTTQNPVLQAFLLAYNNHQDLILSPDDMWLVVCLQYAKYVNENAEQLRSLFVEHSEGKKVMGVEFMQNDWTQFFGSMKSEIQKNVKNEVAELLAANFTTTGQLESLLSAACIMHTFKPYFEYEGYPFVCGIRQVHFMGTLDDWKLLRLKTEKLKMFCINDQKRYDYGASVFKRYIDELLPIFDQFIETYQGRVDQEFWIKVCDITRQSRMPYGYDQRSSYPRLTGWVGKLFSRGQSDDMERLKLDNIRVPLTLIDREEGARKQCFILGGFHGILSTKDYKHRPVMSLAVIEQLKEPKPRPTKLKSEWERFRDDGSDKEEDEHSMFD